MRSDFWKRLFVLAAAVLAMSGQVRAQDDGSTLNLDGGGQEILESIFVPYIAHAPFSLTLATEWVRPLNNGGTFTLVNSRPIKRDSVGRIYMERRGLVPKGGDVPSGTGWIQIADPVAHTLYQCNVPQKVCELLTLRVTSFYPDMSKAQTNDNTAGATGSGRVMTERVMNGHATRTHEDLGATFFLGVPVHHYRDTVTVDPGVLGNDLPMSTIREYRSSAELGFNLTSMLDAPQIGKQIFTVTEISTTEPDPSFFEPPQGYRIVDHRKSAPPTAN